MRIYLDHNATTPLRPEVIEAMARALRDRWGNPSSVHAEGAAARAAVERAREQVAALAGARPAEVVFTAGASEANNTVLSGVGRHLVTTAVEHPSVLAPAEALAARGVRVTRLPVDAGGLLAPEALREALAPDTDLVSILWANNETGVVQPLAPLSAAARAAGVPLHVDATQILGRLPLAGDWDFLSASAHKLNGPKGVGCLVCRRPPPAFVRGGPQERGRRGGTENVAGIVGFGVACALAQAELAERAARASALRDRLLAGLRPIPGLRRNGSAEHALPNTLNVELEGVAGDELVQALDLDGVAASSGAACASGSVSPSHVLLAMGRTPEQARASLRFSVGLGNDEAQVDAAAERVRALVARAREVRAA
jgi:cysteine desulfurase